MRIAIFVQHLLQIPMVCSDHGDIAGSLCRCEDPPRRFINDFRAADFGFPVCCMSDDISVCKIGHDKIVSLANPLDHTLLHIGEAKAGHLVKGDALWRRYAKIILSLKGSLVPPLKKNVTCANFSDSEVLS